MIAAFSLVSCNKTLEPTRLQKSDFSFVLNIQGTVTISGSGPVAGATVSSNIGGTAYSAITDSQGKYSFWAPSPKKSEGTYGISVKAAYSNPAIGSYSGARYVTCEINKATTIDITMNKE